MATRAQMRDIALSMPKAEEKSHFARPDFRIANKIFAGLTEEPHRAYIKARPELQEVLLNSPSGAFTPATGAWGRYGWTYIDLRKVDVTLLREVVADAWRLVAPARLARTLGAAAAERSGSRRTARKRRARKRAAR